MVLGSRYGWVDTELSLPLRGVPSPTRRPTPDPLVIVGRSNALAPCVTRGSKQRRGYGDLTVPVSDGIRRGLVSWDPRRCTYRAEIDVFEPLPHIDPPSARSVDAVWDWLGDPAPDVLPGRIVVGHRSVELLTVDSLINRLATFGFRPDQSSLGALFDLRTVVRDRCGSMVFLGRPRPAAAGSSASVSTGELFLCPPAGDPLPLRSLLELPDHGFGWGRRGPVAVRTASVLVDLAWSAKRDPATEAAAVDLAVTVLAELRGGFVWRAESVADWIATESGDLVGEAMRMVRRGVSSEPVGFRQLCLELR